MTVKKVRKQRVPGALAYLPKDRSLTSLKAAAQKCQGCEIYRNATQVVFGEMANTSDERNAHASRMMLVGEQPGDQAEAKKIINRS